MLLPNELNIKLPHVLGFFCWFYGHLLACHAPKKMNPSRVKILMKALVLKQHKALALIQRLWRPLWIP